MFLIEATFGPSELRDTSGCENNREHRVSFPLLELTYIRLKTVANYPELYGILYYFYIDNNKKYFLSSKSE